MGTNTHTKKTWLLYTPKASPESVLRRVGLETFTTYYAGNRTHLDLSYPRLRVLSVLYEAFIDAMDNGKRELADRDLHFDDLDTTRALLKRLCTLNLVAYSDKGKYAITDYGADEYEFQWYAADKMRQAGPLKKFEAQHNVKPETSRFTEDEVRQLRSSQLTIDQLAELYNASPATIWRVKNYKTYRNVT